MEKVGCRNKFLGLCPKCVYDVDMSHHPNNLECPRYRPMGYLLLVINQIKEVSNAPRDEQTS